MAYRRPLCQCHEQDDVCHVSAPDVRHHIFLTSLSNATERAMEINRKALKSAPAIAISLADQHAACKGYIMVDHESATSRGV